MRLPTTLILLLATAGSATAQTPGLGGTYTSDRAGMEQQATITAAGPGKYRVNLSVSAERCVGKLAATGRIRGDALVTDPPKTYDSCRITIRRNPGGIFVEEDKCLYWHGAACEFSGSYARKLPKPAY